MTWKGNTISDPSPLISSQLAATASSNLWESQLKPFEIVFFELPFWYHFLASILETMHWLSKHQI